MTLDSRINKYYHALNDNDFHILSFIKNNPELCSTLSIKELAKHCSISTASIIRTTQKLGFSGYSEFKFFLKQTDAPKEPSIQFSINLLEHDIQQTIRLFQENITKERLYQTMQNAHMIYAFGIGRGHRLMLEEFSRCLLNIPKGLTIISGFAEFNLAAQAFHKDDLVFIVSQTGNLASFENETFLETIQLLKLRNIPSVSVTQMTNNELSTYTSFNFYYQNSNFDADKKLNRSSFVTLLLLFHLIYEGYFNYLNQ